VGFEVSGGPSTIDRRFLFVTQRADHWSSLHFQGFGSTRKIDFLGGRRVDPCNKETSVMAELSVFFIMAWEGKWGLRDRNVG